MNVAQVRIDVPIGTVAGQLADVRIGGLDADRIQHDRVDLNFNFGPDEVVGGSVGLEGPSVILSTVSQFETPERFAISPPPWTLTLMCFQGQPPMVETTYGPSGGTMTSTVRL